MLEFDFYPTKKGLEETVNICWQIDLFTVYDAILAGGQINTAKITVNVWDFGPLGTSIMPLQRGGFPQ